MLTLLTTRRRHPGRLFHKEEPQIFDLLQLTRSEWECKADFLRIKRKLHKWNSSFEKTGEGFSSSVGYGEAVALRKQAQAALLTYRLVKRERMRAFDEYMGRLPAQNYFLRKAA